MALASEIPGPDLAARAAVLSARLALTPTTEAVRQVLCDNLLGPVALVSSFGAESVVLLHMVAGIAPQTPVLFIDTGKLFAETLDYQQALASRLELRDLRILRPDPEALRRRDPDGRLHRRDADACCALRKIEPLERGLRGFDAWLTGRKRFQTAPRSNIALFESDGRRIKFNPLHAWSRDDLERYIETYRLPRHPLSGRGYPSIGCAPCTDPVLPGEDPRAGRWRGLAKTECGIHHLTQIEALAGAPARGGGMRTVARAGSGTHGSGGSPGPAGPCKTDDPAS